MGRILVIDDDVLVRSTLCDILECAGYDIEEAANGIEGVDRFRARPADLVITDIIMPDREGIETIIELKRQHPSLKIIAISGGAGERLDLLRLAKKFGADGIITKPVDADKLVQAVGRMLDPAGPAHSVVVPAG